MSMQLSIATSRRLCASAHFPAQSLCENSSQFQIGGSRMRPPRSREHHRKTFGTARMVVPKW